MARAFVHANTGDVSVTNLSPLHHRLRQAVGARSYREIGDMTKVHPETVRRYMTGQVPSTEFLVQLAEAVSVNVGWLLTGDGPMYRKDVKLHALRDANPTELLHAVAQTLEALIERVDRLERFVMTIDARSRQTAPTGSAAPAAMLEGRPNPQALAAGINSGSGERTALPVSQADGQARRRATALVDGIFPAPAGQNSGQNSSQSGGQNSGQSGSTQPSA